MALDNVEVVVWKRFVITPLPSAIESAS